MRDRDLILPHGDGVVRTKLIWAHALRETLYPLHQSMFKLQKKHRAADPEPQPFDFARAKRDRPTALTMQTEARLREFLSSGFPPGVMNEMATATRPPLVWVAGAKLNRSKTAIATLAVEVAYRPPAAEHDARINLLLRQPRL